MATYFHGGSEMQPNSDGIHTLYLMNPNYVPYSDTHPLPNMLFLNPSSHALNPSTLPHAPPSNNHFVGIPLSTTTTADAPRLHYNVNLWPPLDQTPDGISAVSESPELGFRRPTATTTLTLSSQQSLYRTLSAEQEIQGGDEIRVSSGNSPASVSVSVVSSSGITGSVQSVILGSKYLKAAQQLLDEVVHVVAKGNKIHKLGTKEKMKMKKESTAAIAGSDPNSIAADQTTSSKPTADLTTAQRQDLQMKKAKLIGMLDEVEQKYRQYHQQMQGVVNSFEEAAGLGSAKSYASLALQTISKQFRCLKDAICAQIKATGKALGEEDWLLGAKIEGSRLRYVDHHLRQQRALQQLGMIQHNTWRPQRGLPERAVSVLRAWLFEHFLHPYPKDSDKIILAKQTGLTRSQVSNWFINARVRLWKPMVEEMYLEEIKEQEQQNGDSQDMMIRRNNNNNKNEANKQLKHGGGDEHKNNNNNNGGDQGLKQNQHQVQMMNIDPQSKNTENLMKINTQNSNCLNDDDQVSILGSLQTHSGGFNLVRPSSDMDILASPKKPRMTNNNNSSSTKSMLLRDIKTTTSPDQQMNHHHHHHHHHHRHHHGGGFGSYPIGEIGSSRFNPELLTPRFHANGVSLTLGLPHNNSDHNLSQNYLSNQNPNPNLHLRSRLDITTTTHSHGPTDHFSDVNPTTAPPHSASTAFDPVEMQTTRRFAAQLLPDFVA